jgi:hypothetical protein
MAKGNDYAAVLRRRLADLAGEGERDQSVRMAMAIAALRGIAGSIGTMPAVDSFNPQGIECALRILADDFERVEICYELSAVEQRAA